MEVMAAESWPEGVMAHIWFLMDSTSLRRSCSRPVCCCTVFHVAQ